MIVTAAELRDVLQLAAVEFHRLDGMTSTISHKPDGSPVTAVDVGIDRFLRERLTAIGPGAGWLSEESSGGPAAVGDWTWVVDPLDGTKEYARRLPECAISIGLAEGDRIRAGAVMNPMEGSGAATGTDGSWLHWPQVRDRSAAMPAGLADAVASVSRTEIEDGSVRPYLDLVGSTRPIGSAANKLMRTACGIDDLTFSVQPKSIWDICGGIALIESRGMKFCRLDGAAVRFDRAQTRVPVGFAAGPTTLVGPLVRGICSRLAMSSGPV